MRAIDLRSDTVTLPTQEMREAISSSVLGDDVFGEDPTTLELQKLSAQMMGKEAALLVPSGTMGNLVCTLTHCARGEEVILGDRSHTFLNEAGGMAALGGLHPRTVLNQPDGTIRLEDIESSIRGDNDHFPRTRLICLENTHNFCSGSPLTPEYTDGVVDLARRHALLVHLDGSRIFNASVALGVDVKRLTRNIDSVTFCLSKGLSAPVGSVVCGSRKFIAEARRTRKVLGGGMRQCGIIAAAGIIALDRMIERIAEDHENAHRLAAGIENIQGLSIDLPHIRTNIVFFNLTDGRLSEEKFLTELSKRGIQFLSIGSSRFRMVTHYGISADDIDRVLSSIREVLKNHL
jgi:threonine aldolase